MEELPDEIQLKLLKLHAALGLTFGAYDLIVTPNREYVFLEVNPAGQWLWLEDVTNLQISKSLANILTGTV